jgi:hypothetical protein
MLLGFSRLGNLSAASRYTTTRCELSDLQIETYFQQLRHLVDACPIVQFSSMTYDKRGTHEGYIRGEQEPPSGSGDRLTRLLA